MDVMNVLLLEHLKGRYQPSSFSAEWGNQLKDSVVLSYLEKGVLSRTNWELKTGRVFLKISFCN
jgi:hypothetical protein